MGTVTCYITSFAKSLRAIIDKNLNILRVDKEGKGVFIYPATHGFIS